MGQSLFLYPMAHKNFRVLIFVPPMAKNFFLFLAVWAGLAACKQKKDNPKVQFSGFVVWEKEYTTFTDCNTGKEYWLLDTDGKIADKIKTLSAPPGQPVFFTVEAHLLPPTTTGAAASFDNSMEVKNIITAQVAPPNDACKAIANKPFFDGMGTAPKWDITTTTDIRFSTNHPKDTLVFFPLVEPTIRDSAGVGKIYYYNIGNENYQTIEIIVWQKLCQTENGKVSRFTSKVIFGGITYTGCATQKTIVNENKPTSYTSPATGRSL